jgi:Predicted membrane protein (DUF2339)
MLIWVLILTLWAFVHWLQLRHRQQKDDERFGRVIDALNRGQSKLEALEKRIHELEGRPTPSPVLAETAHPPVPPPAPKPVGIPTPPSAAKEPKVPVAEERPKAPAPAPAPTPTPPQPAKPPEPVPPPKPLPTPPSPPPRVPSGQAPAPPSAARPIAPPSPRPTLQYPAPDDARGEFERKLGTNWLNKIGITILVIGISLFLAIKFPSLTNPEKIALGYSVSMAILGAGVYLERSDRYRIFARALIGGGWALLFFTTYAMHFVPYTRVIETQSVDLVLLFVVAAAMVTHTLRYDSQVVTGLAFLLAFTTVTISQNTIYSLSAGVILAIGLVTIVHRRAWFELEVFGILASYLNHFVWLTRMVIPVSGHHRVFAEFVPSSVLLCLYWAVYRWSYVARRVERASQETISTIAAILNTSLLLLLFKYQSIHPEWAFYALLILGGTELAIAQLPVLRVRRTAFVILSSIATALLIAAIPFKFSGLDMAIIWLAQAQILLVAGVVVREQLFRSFGFLVALLTAGDMLLNQGIGNLLPRLSEHLTPLAPATALPDYQLAISFLVAAAVFYVNATLIPRRWGEFVTSDPEKAFYRALSYLGGAMLFVGLALAFPHSWTSVAWAAGAFALLVAGRSLNASELTIQTHLFAFSAVIRAIVVNSVSKAPYWLAGGVTLRLVTLTLVVALLYLCARCLSLDEDGLVLQLSEFYTTAAALLVVLLAYHECAWAWIGVGWGMFALALAIFGFYRNRRDLSLQAHLIVLLGFVHTLLFNSDASPSYGPFTLRLITFTSMAALLYLCAYFNGPRDSAWARLFSALHTFAASLLLAWLAFLEVASPWIPVSWALFAFLLLVIGDRVKRKELHVQAYALSLMSVLRVFQANIHRTQAFDGFQSISVRTVTIAMVAALFYLCARWAAMAEFMPNAAFVGAAYTWIASLLVLVLLHYEAYAAAVALSWAVFGAVLFEIGVFRKSRNWRLQGYVVLAVAFLLLWALNLTDTPHDLPRYTLPVATVFYYVYVRLTTIASSDSAGTFKFDTQIQAAPILAYWGSATLVLFARGYFPAGPSLIVWALLALLFIAVAWFWRQDVFLHHSVLLAFLLFLRGLWYEFYMRAYPPGSLFRTRAWYIAAACAILFACQGFAFPLRARFAAAENEDAAESSTASGVSRFLRRPEQIYFFLPMILVTLLIAQEVSTGRLTIAWGVEAVLAFLFALVAGERTYRLSGLSLLLGCVAKILVLDVWRQQRSDRYITLIILGVASLLVSYLYTRYSETIHRYL